ncbi:GDPmannose 4,6-dehydratase [Maridesulfovibrio ferrireducens]|uniref:GDP-mannose 4,6-dehydratase n=1 Tax=Maridesulfovibrio ferrireducens TaxID=246191 RepID=A0A1G9EU06_9BACT|nr:GDP-mannose 4,6-dehydratase [Maridesulfovibrio ferrireducens]SDK79485.1 GDPmannose 4,6-dehydratase [Maridesulfovibrio ferrireducens]
MTLFPDKVLITGATGQDGRLAAEILISAGSHVIGIQCLGRSNPKPDHPITEWYWWDFRDRKTLEDILDATKPNAILHLAANHHQSTHSSIDAIAEGAAMMDTNLGSVMTLVPAIMRVTPKAMLVAAGSSQIFGKGTIEGSRVNETTPPNPHNSYALAKDLARRFIAFHRRHDGFRGATAILFNHESRYRSDLFVTRIISKHVASLVRDSAGPLQLKNIGARADWCAAQDAVLAMLTMTSMKTPRDYIVSSGNDTALTELLEHAYGAVGLDWRNHVKGLSNKSTPYLVGDNNEITSDLGWRATTSMRDVMRDMVQHDLALLEATGDPG